MIPVLMIPTGSWPLRPFHLFEWCILMTMPVRALVPRLLAGACLLAVVSCGGGRGPGTPPSIPSEQHLTAVSFSALPGWNSDALEDALPALRNSCDSFQRRPDARRWVGPGSLGGTVEDWQRFCSDLGRAFPASRPVSSSRLAAFLEDRLQPWAVNNSNKKQGTFTGYYEAELKGCLKKTLRCQVPLYGPPPGVVTDVKKAPPLPSRAAIETGALDGRAPVLMYAENPVDVHIMQIQGSGRVILPDGSVRRLGFAGSNGHPFKGLGRILLDRGVLESGQATMPFIRAWLKDHPDRAVSLMQENPRYTFFRTVRGDGPVGALSVPLTAQRSLAVDPRYVPLGVPLWLDTVDPDRKPLRRLMVAQDTGSAIKGVVRGDFFWGSGEPALAKAGRMKSAGTWYLLLPRRSTPTS